MNTIKWYLSTSGGTADLKKDFALYQGQYQSKLLNIYVPTSLLAPEFKTIADGSITSDYVAGTAVMVSMKTTARNGEYKLSRNYYLRFLKTLTYMGVEYALFERKLPKEFTLYAGQGANAPKIIANVVNVETDTEPAKMLSVITSQEAPLDVMPSADLTYGDTVDPTALEEVNARLNAIDSTLLGKQDKTDLGLATTSKTVVGAINENKGRIDTNETNIMVNIEDISNLTDRVAELEQNTASVEDYVGAFSGTALPTDSELNNYVVQTVGRQPKNADVIIFTLDIPDGTDKNYKYIYATNTWHYYEIPALETASNGTLGILKGTFGVGSYNATLVDISGGEILNIYVKDTSGSYRNIREFLNTADTTLDSIISGDTAVGLAVKAVNDQFGNEITNTYLTKNIGATKQFVHDYALPREFNDIYYLTANGYSKTAPTETTPIHTITTNAVGDFAIVEAIKDNDATFELSSKNSVDNKFYISANRDTTITLRLTTQAKNQGENWTDLAVELSTPIQLTADQINKVDFTSIFTYLGDKVLSLDESSEIKQTLEITTTESATTTFDIYSNETYPSTFGLNTLSLVVKHTSGLLGEQIILSANGTETEVYDFVVEDPDHYTQYRENGVEFLVDLHLPLVGELTATKPVVITFGDTVYYLHIGASGENLTMGDLQGYQTYNSATGYRYLFKAVFSTGEIAGFVLVDGSWATKTDIDELREMISQVDVAVDNTTIIKNTENQLSVATDIMDAITTEWEV